MDVITRLGAAKAPATILPYKQRPLARPVPCIPQAERCA